MLRVAGGWTEECGAAAVSTLIAAPAMSTLIEFVMRGYGCEAENDNQKRFIMAVTAIMGMLM
jgi:hypothetical protein